MKCWQIVAKLSAYIDGELDSELEQMVFDHLRQCISCRRVVEQLRGIHVLLDELPRIAVPRDFAERVVAASAKISYPEKLCRDVRCAWVYLMEMIERFFDLLQSDKVRSTRTLDEFNDVPASFLSYAYFKMFSGTG